MSKRILFVEDNDSYRQMMVEILEAYGHRVTQAESGSQALQLMSSGYTPDVAIIDLHMPKMDGIELTREIRKRYLTPVYLCTADEKAESLIEGIELIWVVDKSLEGIRSMIEGVEKVV
jgi:CheY-like chemotaxis protein